MTRLRCAIYTRKSTEEGLEQEFSSLDAQYESCKAYIASQKHEGWTLARERYDDGGYSGGSMERPGLKALLEDVSAGKVDIIIVYKIDRLTRSLADFARIVELLENAKASFVSVTQAFNTKTSMGRLMLHVLLSFAQFEREVGAERVRDKIAASKAKGMWMGGTIPIGYDLNERKLIVNQDEAATVHAVFTAFARLKSVPATLCWAQREGLVTKVRHRDGERLGGNLFTYGSLRCLLTNRLYAGEVEHKGNIYPGQQDTIIDKVLFEDVQQIVAGLSSDGMRGPKVKSASVLMGLIVDCHGRTMGPVHTRRSGQQFRYYVTHHKLIGKEDPAPYRLPGEELERHCCALLADHLAATVSSVDGDRQAKQMARVLRDGRREQKRALMIEHVNKVIIGDGQLTLHLIDGAKQERSIERVRHGNDAKLVVGPRASSDQPKTDPQLLVLLRDIQRVQQLALGKPKLSLEKLARRLGRSTERTKRLLRLASLSPTIVTTILDGHQPARLTNRFLQNLDRLPISWAEQERLLLG